MEKEKVLEIEFKQVWDKWAWKVTKWGINKDEMFGNLCTLFSKHEGCYMYFVHMLNKPKLDTELISSEVKKIMEKSIDVINKYYGKLKKWRAEKGSDYYFVDGFMAISKNTEMGLYGDEVRYEAGNYFQTEEEAREYAEKIKKMLQERK